MESSCSLILPHNKKACRGSRRASFVVVLCVNDGHAYPAAQGGIPTLQDDADEAAAALIDDPLQRFLKLCARLVGHAVEFIVESLADELMQ